MIREYLRDGRKPSRLTHMNLLIMNGPNLNLLGTREPSVYGTATLRDLEGQWIEHAERVGATLDTFQSNHEGSLVDAIHDAMDRYDGLIINAGALTHYSYSLRDAVAASGIPTVEVHISNIYEREEWRHYSVLSDVCDLTIVGRGADGYRNAIDHLVASHTLPPISESYGGHREAVLDLRIPSGAGLHPVVLLIHGGFWRSIWKRDLMDPMAVALTELGWATVNVEYTRGKGSYGAALNDATAAVDWIREHASEHGLDADHIVAVGHSAGGFLALKLAHAGAPIAGAVPLGSVTDLGSLSKAREEDDPVAFFLGSDRDEAPRLWEQAEISGTPRVPIHLIHGATDETVLPSQSEVYSALNDQATSLTIIDEYDHMDVIDPLAGSWDTITEALDQFRIE
jgi:3-dehydroquinate dehydratase-2